MQGGDTDEEDIESEDEQGGERRDINEQEEKLYGVAIQFQKDPNNVLRVFDIKKNGPAWCCPALHTAIWAAKAQT